MKIINNPLQSEIQGAAHSLKNGQLVVFPTETVYGLGADATNEAAVGRIYSAKSRPKDHPLIVHIYSSNKMKDWSSDIPDYAYELASKYWPGPLTLILKRSCMANNYLTGGSDYVGLRVPAHPIALKLLEEFELLGGDGIAAPSANRFGAVSPTNLEAAFSEIGNQLEYNDVLINGGDCSIGIESTIVSCMNSTPIILRPGAITNRMISSVLKINLEDGNFYEEINRSGSYKKHYSPRAKVSLNTKPREGEGLIAMKNIATPKNVTRLLAPNNLEEFARGIYEALRLGDKLELSVINVYLPDSEGIGVALLDRLKKASHQSPF